MRDLLNFWANAARRPDDEGGSGDGEGETEAAANLATIRSKLGIGDNEDPEELLTEFTDEERAELLGGTDGDDDDGTGDADDGDGDDDKGADGKGGEKDGQPADDDQPPPKGFVKLGALQEARAENREIRQRLDKVQSDFQTFQQRLVERLADIRGGKKPGEAADAGPPDANKDPVGAIEYWKKKTEELEARVTGKEKQQEEAVQQHQQEQEYTQYVLDTADEILTTVAKADPAIADAFAFAQKAVAEELQAKGFKGKALEAEFNKLLVQYAENAPNEPKAFAEYVRRNARYWGWDPKAAPKPGQKQPNGETKLTPAEKLAMLRKGVKQSKSLSGGGHSTGGELNVDDLAEMTGEELEKLAETNPELFEAAVKRA